jgi:Na+/melibiose symporter-like transporter
LASSLEYSFSSFLPSFFLLSTPILQWVFFKHSQWLYFSPSFSFSSFLLCFFCYLWCRSRIVPSVKHTRKQRPFAHPPRLFLSWSYTTHFSLIFIPYNSHRSFSCD